MSKNARESMGPPKDQKQRMSQGPVLLLKPLLSTEVLLWLPGQSPRKSNQRRVGRIGRKGGGTRPIVRLSAKAECWMEGVIKTMPADAKLGLGSAEDPIGMTCWCWYSTHSPDLSVELIMDALQKSGVLFDDRYVFSFAATKIVDADLQGVLVHLWHTGEEWEARNAYQTLVWRLGG